MKGGEEARSVARGGRGARREGGWWAGVRGREEETRGSARGRWARGRREEGVGGGGEGEERQGSGGSGGEGVSGWRRG